MSNYIIGVIAAIMLAIVAYVFLGDLLGGKNPFPPVTEEPKVVVPDLAPKNEGINPVRPLPTPIETPKPTVETPKP